jgi:hypothetical protein
MMNRHHVKTLVGTVGLLFDIAGALVLAQAVIVSETEAEELAGTYMDFSPAQKADRLKQSKKAKWGSALLAIGFLGQLVALWI